MFEMEGKQLWEKVRELYTAEEWAKLGKEGQERVLKGAGYVEENKADWTTAHSKFCHLGFKCKYCESQKEGAAPSPCGCNRTRKAARPLHSFARNMQPTSATVYSSDKMAAQTA